MANHGAVAPGSAEVAQNLSNADKAEGLSTEAHATVGVPEHHEDPALFGVLNGTVWVSIAMLVFILILLVKGVPKLIVGGLDKQIQAIRDQLDAAATLRKEAEALRDEYAAKIADAETSAKAMIAHADEEAKALIAKAGVDADELVARRAKMAEDKIAAAERAAIAEVRAKTAAAAAKAATALIAAKLDANGDKALVDRTIAGLNRPN